MLAPHSVKSSKTKGVVDKTKFPFTEPWEVTKKPKGASHELTHLFSKKVTKKHAMHTSPVPPNMQSFALLDGVNSRHGQLYHSINHDAYTLGGVEVFLPLNPFKDSILSLTPCMWCWHFLLRPAPLAFCFQSCPAWLSSIIGCLWIRITIGQRRN